MIKFFRNKFGAHFHPIGEAPPNRVATVFVLTILLFVVANAYRNPPDFLAQLDQPTGHAVANTQELDQLFIKLTAPGNVVLRYEGFDYSTTAKQEKVMFEYIRAAYATYPKRVYVADANTLVPQGATGDPFPDFSPSPDWQNEHQISAIITSKRSPDGTVRYYKNPPTKP